MSTVAQLLERHRSLHTVSARLDAELILCAVINRSRSYLYTWPDREVEVVAEAQYQNLMQRRTAGEPVAHILEEREFWSLALKVNGSTLIPRPETETLVEWALDLALAENAKVLDLGTGTGAIALALATERPDWHIMATDVSEDAIALAGENCRQQDCNHIKLVLSNWYSSVEEKGFNLVVSNPPYIASDDVHLKQGDVRFEPRSALVSGVNGMDDLEHIVAGSGDFLLEDGWLLLEHGCDQGADVLELLLAKNFTNVTTRCDLSGNERISGGQWACG
jgi:release factor glutamine methyltransferase